MLFQVSKADTFLIVALAPVDFEGNNGFDFTLSRTRDEKQEVIGCCFSFLGYLRTVASPRSIASAMGIPGHYGFA